MTSAGGSPGIAQAARRWGVVGGGMLGLTLAHRLARQGRDVTVFEGADRLGGLASAWGLGPVTWDRHYHVTLFSDTALRGLLGELDLERELRWVRTRTGFYTGGRLYSMSNALEFLRFPPLGLVDKIRLAVTILHASRIRDWQSLERIPVADWLRRWSGPAHAREDLAAPAARQAGGGLPRDLGRLHLGDHRAALRRAPQRPEGGALRLRARRLRARPRALRRGPRGRGRAGAPGPGGAPGRAAGGTAGSPSSPRTARARSSTPSSSPRRRPSRPGSSPGSRTTSARGSRRSATRGSSAPRCCSSGRWAASTSRTSPTTGCPSRA